MEPGRERRGLRARALRGRRVARPAIRQNGTTTTAWGTHSQARALALQPDGKIVVAGQIFYQAKFALARYKPDGSLDPTFAGNGKQTFPVGIASGEVRCVQPDGKIVVAGYSSDDTGSAVALARLKSNGLPDPGFGTDGITTTAIGSNAAAEALVLQPDGKIVVAGSSAVGGGFTRATLVRYGVGGALDADFGSGGVATLAGSPNNADAHALALQPDGKIVVAGNDSGRGLLLARYTSNGALDQGFGSGGSVLTRLEDPARPRPSRFSPMARSSPPGARGTARSTPTPSRATTPPGRSIRASAEAAWS